jgi:hypothetical protein
MADHNDIFKNREEARKVYDRYLFHFVELRKLEIQIIDSYDPLSIQKKMIEYLNYDPSYILDVPIIECNSDNKDEINEMVINGLKHDLVILRGFLDKFDFNPEYFTEKFIIENYKDQKVEVIEQIPNFLGFTDNLYFFRLNLIFKILITFSYFSINIKIYINFIFNHHVVINDTHGLYLS